MAIVTHAQKMEAREGNDRKSASHVRNAARERYGAMDFAHNALLAGGGIKAGSRRAFTGTSRQETRGLEGLHQFGVSNEENIGLTKRKAGCSLYTIG